MENKVANKAIETIDLLKLIDLKQILGLDFKEFLFQELILKEKDFRANLKSFDFSVYQSKLLYLHCSNQAIVPMWAYMLFSSYLSDHKIEHCFANGLEEAIEFYLIKAINALDWSVYSDKRVIVKGCGGKISLGPEVYMLATEKLQKHAKAISYGEACSMVPVFKKI